MKNHTQKIGNSYLNRRSLLSRAGMGIGALALLDLNRRCLGSDNPLAPSEMHHPAKAKAVISLFMHGGPSQVDTFDPKPLLQQYAGKTLPPGFADLNLEFTKASEAVNRESRCRISSNIFRRSLMNWLSFEVAITLSSIMHPLFI